MVGAGNWWRHQGWKFPNPLRARMREIERGWALWKQKKVDLKVMRFNCVIHPYLTTNTLSINQIHSLGGGSFGGEQCVSKRNGFKCPGWGKEWRGSFIDCSQPPRSVLGREMSVSLGNNWKLSGFKSDIIEKRKRGLPSCFPSFLVNGVLKWERWGGVEVGWCSEWRLWVSCQTITWNRFFGRKRFPLRNASWRGGESWTLRPFLPTIPDKNGGQSVNITSRIQFQDGECWLGEGWTNKLSYYRQDWIFGEDLDFIWSDPLCLSSLSLIWYLAPLTYAPLTLYSLARNVLLFGVHSHSKCFWMNSSSEEE